MSVKKTLEFLRRPGEARPDVEDVAGEATIFGTTDVGCLRERNEDQFVVARLERSVLVEQCGYAGNDGTRHVDHPVGRLMMVADGMGGQVSGDVASAVVVDAMLQYAFSMLPWLRMSSAADERALAEGLTKAVQRSHERMQEVARRKGLTGDMGSTLTMGYLVWPMLYLVHVGDSRAYLLRGGELFRLTRDHNLAEEMVRMKVMSEEEARSSRFASVLTNCVSTSTPNEELRVELHQVELKREDKVLLCTDGLYGEVPDADIKGRLMHVVRPDLVAPCVESLVALARENGGSDNITAVLGYF
ncbi:MAG: serine/threonine-protein phosphatase [Myxococcales bacterium]|nr:serine/threonine-protein phosphatase [Myxococcales bacterium]